jgi:hypothetical protein
MSPIEDFLHDESKHKTERTKSSYEVIFASTAPPDEPDCCTPPPPDPGPDEG